MTDETRETATEGQHESERQTTDGRREADRQCMADISHTNPTTGETFGTVYRRGPAVTDGGAADARGTDTDPSAETDEDREPMREVDHTPRDGDGANEVWERGEEDVPTDDHTDDVDDVHDAGDVDE